MRRFRSPALLALLAAACADPSGPAAPAADASAAGAPTLARAAVGGHTLYGLTADGQLVVVGSDQPNRILRSTTITGLAAGDRLLGIDFRPSGPAAGIGRLYAVGTSGRIYTIDPATGAATAGAQLTVAPVGGAFGFGFNPVPDRLRIHSDAEQNLRIDVATGATIVDGPLAYQAGDRNAGANPTIVATAYTNSDDDPTTGTALYAIDAALDVLVRLPNPNDGRLVTVGSLGVDTRSAAGFDIVGTADGVAYAALSVSPSGKSGLYAIDLATGRATLLGLLAQTKSYLVSIAVAP